MTTAHAAPTSPIRVMIVDDNRQVRGSVAALLEASGDIIVCGEAAAACDAGSMVISVEPDVAIIDLRLGGESGIRAGRQVRGHRPQTRVILLTSASEEEAMFATALAGADGYLIKQLRQIDIVGAVHTVSEGGHLRGAMSEADVDHLRTRLGGLDPTEEGLFALVIDGLSDGEIAAALGLGEAEVRSRVGLLLSRLEIGLR